MAKYDHYNKNNNKKTVNDKPTEENQNFINMEELLKNNRKLDKVQEEESLWKGIWKRKNKKY